MTNIPSFFLEAAAQYKVPDLTGNETLLLFILESPHKEEIKHGVPLAGSSGKAVSSSLVGKNEKTPFGMYIQKSDTYPIGIMNVCPFPLQKTAYPECWAGVWNEEITIAEAVRKSQAASFKHNEKNIFHQLLLSDFKGRLTNIKNEALLIPCGKFAEKYVELATNNEEFSVLKGVPHPSYNSWSRPRYQSKIAEVLEAVRMKQK